MKKEQNGKESLRMLKFIVGCNASKRIIIITIIIKSSWKHIAAARDKREKRSE